MKHSIVPQLCIYTHEKSVTGKRHIMENKISFIFLLILFCIFQIWGEGEVCIAFIIRKF